MAFVEVNREGLRKADRPTTFKAPFPLYPEAPRGVSSVAVRELPAATDPFAASGPGDALAFESRGPCTILRVIGIGGMGAISLAGRFAPSQRRVARKVIRTGAIPAPP